MIKTMQNLKNKTEEQGFIISIDEAMELKFNLDVLRKEMKKAKLVNTNATYCIGQITRILNNAKKERPITFTEGRK